MIELYEKLPIFLWEALLNFTTLLLVGLIFAFVTTFYLKRKDESTRVAGVILEKRVNAQHEILRYLEDNSQKLEMQQRAAQQFKELLQQHDFELPYNPHIQYADIFSSVEKYRVFFHGFEVLFSKHGLWLDAKSRHHMLSLQGCFAAINASLLVFNRLAALGGVELADTTMEKLSNQLLLALGIALDEEFNHLIMDLDVLMVTSADRCKYSPRLRSLLTTTKVMMKSLNNE